MQNNSSKLSESSIWKNDISLLVEQQSPVLLKMAKSHAPDFFLNLHKIQPKLLSSELIFCIYLKLNYNTKEISKFLDVSVKAIQNRKNRIRKKLNIPSDTNIYNWFNKI